MTSQQMELIPAAVGHCPLQGKPCSSVHSDAEDAGKIFFAYPSTQTSLDVIPRVAELLTDSKGLPVESLDWRELDIEGGPIFCRICWAIRNSRLLVADITDFNLNVMFEFGFAIACGVTVYPVLFESQRNKAAYKSFQTMTTIGYAGYRNSKTLFERFEKRKIKPWERKPLLESIPNIQSEASTNAYKLLYLMSDSSSEASLRITEEIQASGLERIVDDPDEFEARPLTWYIRSIQQASAVIAHVDDLSEPGSLQSAKIAVALGMAVASGRRVLLVSNNVETAPIDYHDLVKEYKTANEAAAVTYHFLSEVRSLVRERLTGGSTGRIVKRQDLAGGFEDAPLLARVDLGDADAVNEESELPSYFVETPQYQTALRPGFHLISGRKGSGKSAVALMTANHFQSVPKREFVVARIYPRRYELDELTEQIGSHPENQSPYFGETVWKYLIITEALRLIKPRLDGLPRYHEANRVEKELLDVLEQYKSYLEVPFASRLIALLKDPERIRSDALRDRPLSEQLQATEIARLMRALCGYLSQEELGLVITIDGIEGSWAQSQDRAGVAQVLLALVNASRDLRRSLGSEIDRRQGNASVTMDLFMRSDVLEAVLTVAEEPDKILYDPLYWDDTDDLLNVVAQRILASAIPTEVDDFDWESILDEAFDYQALQGFVLRHMIPRPRDVVYFFDKAISHALSRHRYILTRQDFLRAQKEYSEYAVRALSREWVPKVRDVEQVLLAFVNAPRRLSRRAVVERLDDIGISTEHFDDVITFLVDSHFLGLSVGDGAYRYVVNPTQAKVVRAQHARAMKDRTDADDFEVHPAFHENLGIGQRS